MMSENADSANKKVFSTNDYQLIQIKNIPDDGLEIPIVYSREINEEPELPSRYEDQVKSQIKSFLEQKRENLLKEKQLLQRKVEKYRELSKNMNFKKEVMTKTGQWRVKRFRKACERVFSKTQIELMLGKRKRKWSHDDLAVAYNVLTLGNHHCLEYVKQYMKIPLPSRGCITRWLSLKKFAAKPKREG